MNLYSFASPHARTFSDARNTFVKGDNAVRCLKSRARENLSINCQSYGAGKLKALSGRPLGGPLMRWKFNLLSTVRIVIENRETSCQLTRQDPNEDCDNRWWFVGLQSSDNCSGIVFASRKRKFEIQMIRPSSIKRATHEKKHLTSTYDQIRSDFTSIHLKNILEHWKSIVSALVRLN